MSLAPALPQVTEPEGAAEPSARTRYTPTEPVNVSQTLGILSRGGDGPCFRRVGNRVWLTLRTPLGGATLCFGADAHGVSVEAWGPGADWAIDGVPALLGAADDWSDLDLTRSPLLAEVRRRNPGMRLTQTRGVWEMFVPAVLEQKVTCVEAWRSWRRLVRQYGEPAPGPAPEGMVIAPAAETWRMIPRWEWHTAGVGPGRSETIVRSSRVASALERMPADDPREATRRLTTLPGVGAWTAAEVTSRAHGDADALSVGDYHLATNVGLALTGSPVDDDGMLDLLEPWAGQRQRIVRLVWASGIRKPRRGPRITIQDHRRH